MKKIKISILALLAISILSCSKDTNSSIIQENAITQQGVSPEILSKIESMGFNTKKLPIIVTDKGYVIEGDILIPKESLEEERGQKQRVLNVVNCSRARNIRIKNQIGNNEVGKQFGRALRLLNNINGGSTLKLTEVKNNPDIVVRLAKPEEKISSFGYTTLPRNGAPSPEILLEREQTNDGKKLTSRQWSNVIIHEICHSLGVLHTNMSGGETIHIPGTPDIDNQEKDELSIMSAGDDNLNAVINAPDLSKYDKRTIRRMFHENKGRRICK